MKKIKKILMVLLVAVMAFTMTRVNAEEETTTTGATTGTNKVKVYVFEAGGCPYCEAELEYLQSLSSYNETFEVIVKELYIDHNTWEPGADYELGYKVATAFYNAGFKDASYQATPFVVISDLYAAAAYSTSLESIINQAYEEGDKDVVGCFANGGENCIPEKPSDGSETIRTVVLLVLFGGLIAMIYFARKNNDDKYEEDEDEERDYEEKEIEKVEVEHNHKNKKQNKKKK